MLIAEYIKQPYAQWYNTPILLESAKRSLYSKVKEQKTETQYQELEEYLNSQFYNKNNQNISQKFFKEVQQIYENDIQRRLYNAESSWSVETTLEKFGMERKLIQQMQNFNNVNGMQIRTVDKFLNALNTIEQDVFSKMILTKNQLRQLRSITKQLKNILSKLENDYKVNTPLSKQKDTDLVGNTQIMKNLATGFKQLLQDVKFTTEQNGELFEIGLALLNYKSNEALFSSIEATALDVIKDSKTGQIQGNRTGVTVDTIFHEGDATKTPAGAKLRIGNKNFEITGDFSNPKQVKADIQMFIPNIGDFYVSAKNWESMLSGQYYGLGETSLFGAVNRSINNSLALEHYLYAVGPYEHNNEQFSSFHEISRISLAVDMLWGSFKNTSYNADTLVINDRKSQKVRVYSGAQLLNDFINQTNNILGLQGFDIAAITTHITQVMKKYTSYMSWGPEASVMYKAEVISYLSSIHVRLLMNSF